jgi:hypothetical protein
MSDTECDDGLKNPMRFSIKNREIDVENYLRHPDFHSKRVTEIEVQSGQLYIHWECAEKPSSDISDCPVCGGNSEYVEHLGPTSLHRCETADCPVQTHVPNGGGDCNV